MFRAGLPGRRLAGQRLDDRIPGQRVVEGHDAVDPGESGPVGKQVSDRYGFLARLGELGPIPDNRRVDVEEPLLGQSVGAHGSRALGGRVRENHRVFFPRLTGDRVRHPAPQVDHLVSPVVGGKCRPVLVSLVEVRAEHFADGLEPGSDPTIDHRHDPIITDGSVGVQRTRWALPPGRLDHLSISQ